MAILSRYPILGEKVEDYSGLIWSEFGWANLPTLDGKPFYSDEALATQRLSTRGHWIVPIQLPNAAELRLLVFHATAPVFDGPENRNGHRNADEVRFWSHYLDEFDAGQFALVGNANLDPEKGNGNRAEIRALLEHPKTQDPFSAQPNDTVDWSDIELGKMRVSYILPSSDLSVAATGMIWPDSTEDGVSRHALIWADLETPAPVTAQNLETSGASQ